MTPMYFFLMTFFFCHLCNSMALKNAYVTGKSQSIPINYDYLMNSGSYIDMSGIDHRCPYIENTTNFIPMFAELLKKQQLLMQLQNKNDSLINKQILLEDYNEKFSESDYNSNILAGGLLMDWEAIIE